VIIVQMLKRYWIPDFLHSMVSLSMVVLAFTASNYIQEDSGLLTVTVMGIVLANQKSVNVRHIIEFKENLRVLLLSSLFILLAARLDMDQLTGFGIREGLFVAALIFIARPLAVAISSVGSRLSWRERVFLGWMAPRGIVAAAVSSVFALQMNAAGYAQSEQLVPLTFLVIVATVVIYGLTAKPLSAWLGISQAKSDGILFVGAHSWAREIAAMLQREGCPVLMADTNRDNIARARMDGLPSCYASVLSPDVDEEIDLSVCLR
jgi:NhaP-type Na+/H+ or K+/H+ antiporter